MDEIIQVSKTTKELTHNSDAGFVSNDQLITPIKVNDLAQISETTKFLGTGAAIFNLIGISKYAYSNQIADGISKDQVVDVIDDDKSIPETSVLSQNRDIASTKDQTEKQNSGGDSDFMNLLKYADMHEVALYNLLTSTEYNSSEQIDPDETLADENDLHEVQDSDQGIVENLENIEPSENDTKSVEMFTLDVNPDDWAKIVDGRLLKPTYVQYFVTLLMDNKISCVLKSNGFYPNKNSFSIRFKCTQTGCRRIYHLKQIPNSHKFIVKRNPVPINHTYKKTRPICGPQRDITRSYLRNHFPSDYSVLANSSLNRQIYSEKNLQDVVSDTTLRKLRDEALQLQDFDKDDMMDLLKRKLTEKLELAKNKKADIFYRRLGLDPFVVSAFSNKQFDCVNMLAEKDDDLTIYLDATGSLADHSGKKVYYYAGVVNAKINKMDVKETGRLLPTVQFISGEHDTFNIEIQLREYKHEYEKRHPKKQFPFKHTVTDFSFALLNAVCHAWNNVGLIVYINFMYKLANGDLEKDELIYFNIVTYIQLCAGHLSKTHAVDVAQFYSTMSMENQAILKEIFAMMINMKSLEDLRETWRLLSCLTPSKYVTEDVTSALRQLAKKSTETKTLPETKNSTVEVECDQNRPEDDRLPNDIDKYKSMYENSLFYQDFKSITFKEVFHSQVGTPNAFYSVRYTQVFLKKYISVLCFWTCLTQNERSSNSCAECHFKNTKSHMHNKAPAIGSLPLKPGRLMNELKLITEETADAVMLELPRHRCCNRETVNTENVPSKNKPKVRNCKTFMDIYKGFPKTPTTPQTTAHLRKKDPSTATSTTPTTSLSKTTTTIPSSLLEVTPSTSLQKTLTGKPKLTGRKLADMFDKFQELDDDEIAIDNPFVEEQETLTRKRKLTETKLADTFNKFQKLDDDEIAIDNPFVEEQKTLTRKRKLTETKLADTFNKFQKLDDDEIAIDNPFVEEQKTLTRKRKLTETKLADTFDKLQELDDDEIAIDNPFVEEQWCRTKVTKYSHMNKETLKKIDDDNAELNLQKILTKEKTKKESKKTTKDKLESGLHDEPSIYLKPQYDYVVATKRNLVLRRSDYESIQEGMTDNVIHFVLTLLQSENTQIQIETKNTSSILTSSALAPVKFQNKLFFGVNLNEQQPTLLIINFQKKEISHISAATSPVIDDTFFHNFLRYVEHHNKKYRKSRVEATGWQIVHLEHQIEEKERNQRIALLQFVTQYIVQNT